MLKSGKGFNVHLNSVQGGEDVSGTGTWYTAGNEQLDVIHAYYCRC